MTVKEAGCQYRERRQRLGGQPKRTGGATHTNIRTHTVHKALSMSLGGATTLPVKNRTMVIHEF